MSDPSPTVPPRRGDKFAALQQQQQNAPAAAAAPKRDKFAAMQSRAEGSKSLASQQVTVEEPSPIEDERITSAKRQQMKFSKVWNDLQVAEAATIKLLRLARDTAKSLQQADTLDPSQTSLPQLDDFVTTLQSIHARLAPHAHYVRAYSAPMEPNETYLAKMELNMARQKHELICDWNKLLEEEQEEGNLLLKQDNSGVLKTNAVELVDVGSKRKRTDDGT